jgi:hypothetical protein
VVNVFQRLFETRFAFFQIVETQFRILQLPIGYFVGDDAFNQLVDGVVVGCF